MIGLAAGVKSSVARGWICTWGTCEESLHSPAVFVPLSVSLGDGPYYLRHPEAGFMAIGAGACSHNLVWNTQL